LAVKTKLVEKYIDQFGNIVKSTSVSVLPVETANLKTFFEGVATVSSHTKDADTHNMKVNQKGE
jgi:hypothetical protein